MNGAHNVRAVSGVIRGDIGSSPEGQSSMKTNKLLVAAVLAIALGAPIAGFVANMGGAQPMTSTEVRVPFLHGFPTVQIPSKPKLSSLERATEWLNSPPLTPAALRGKVVLVEFWTYSCINWLRTLPYVRAWADKYRDQGFVVIGAHTPEFEFETDVDNVRHAMSEMMIDYPVAIDSDYAIWEAFENHYWPALYFVDAQGQIRHHQFGEGEYEQSERVIQQLLVEAE